MPIIGKLYRNRIEITVYGRSLLNASAIDGLKHIVRYAVTKAKNYVYVNHTQFSKQSMNCKLLASIDIGKLAYDYHYGQGKESNDLVGFIKEQLAPVVDKDDDQAPQDVVLYGFGRIGRLLARLLIERQGENNKLRLRAIVVRGGKDGDLEKRASLLRRDSVHGLFIGSITVDNERSDFG